MSGSRCEVSQLVNWYREFLENGKSAAFVSCVSTRYSIATISRLAASADRESRRASVLALGMMGDHTAIGTVGKCLRDSDRCVRLVAEIAFADLCRREYGDAPRRQLEIARRHLDGERLEKSQSVLQALVIDCPRFSEAWYLSAVIKFCYKDFVSAIAMTRRAASFNSNHFAAHALEAKSWLEIGTPSRALASFRRSFAINPSQTMVQGYIDVLSRQVRTGGS